MHHLGLLLLSIGVLLLLHNRLLLLHHGLLLHHDWLLLGLCHRLLLILLHSAFCLAHEAIPTRFHTVHHGLTLRLLLTTSIIIARIIVSRLIILKSLLWNAHLLLPLSRGPSLRDQLHTPKPQRCTSMDLDLDYLEVVVISNMFTSNLKRISLVTLVFPLNILLFTTLVLVEANTDFACTSLRLTWQEVRHSQCQFHVLGRKGVV